MLRPLAQHLLRINRLSAVPLPRVTQGSPLTITGENSKLLEIDMSRGAYRVSWTAGGHGIFSLRDESARGGEGRLLSNGVVPNPSFGEAIARVDTNGRRIISVEASKLTWELTFTYL